MHKPIKSHVKTAGHTWQKQIKQCMLLSTVLTLTKDSQSKDRFLVSR